MSVAAALMTTFAASPAAAFYLDGGKLQGQCAAMSRDGSYRVADGLVGGYVAGVVDQALAREPRTKPAFCLPAGTDLKRVRDVVCRYAARHTEERRTTAATLVRLALTETFPCPREARERPSERLRPPRSSAVGSDARTLIP